MMSDELNLEGVKRKKGGGEQMTELRVTLLNMKEMEIYASFGWPHLS